MKKFLLSTLFVLCVASFAHADKQGNLPDFIDGSSMTIIGISNSSWTDLTNSTFTVFRLDGPANSNAYFIDHVPQNQSDCLVAITTSPVAPGTTFYGYTYRTSDVPWILSLDRRLHVWAISAGSVVQQLIFQQFR